MEGEAGLPGKLYFRIGEVAELVGVEPHVLRYWETEFRMRPHRSSSGHRLYRKKDIQRFLRIRKLLHTEGFTIAGARKALTDGEGTKASAATPGVDMEKLQDAAERVETLQHQLLALRMDVLAGPFTKRQDPED